jgi:hypothetical protein
MSDDNYWFAPKRYGYGAGLPIAWQGWVATIVHLTVIALVVLWLHKALLALAITLSFVVFGPLPLYAAKTRGGWKWRVGGKPD